MQTKILEIRDRATFIPVLCVEMRADIDDILVAGTPRERIAHRLESWEAQRYYLRRFGYPEDGQPSIAIAKLDAHGGKFWSDPFGWGDRTYQVAHEYIIDHWAELKDGAVIDVEFILGETERHAISERFLDPPERRDG